MEDNQETVRVRITTDERYPVFEAEIEVDANVYWGSLEGIKDITKEEHENIERVFQEFDDVQKFLREKVRGNDD